MTSILYITYDGLTDALGQSQILAYLKRISDPNTKIVILSFEKEEAFEKGACDIRKIIAAHRLVWVPLIYSKRPPVLSTVWDVYKGLKESRALQAIHQFQIVHCRSYISAILGRKLQKQFSLKFIFDMRGWWPDEKLESGYWSGGLYVPVYNYFKKLERRFFADADYAVSLTYKGKEEIVKQQLAPADKVGVIPTCVDFDIFKPRNGEAAQALRIKLGITPAEKVFVYSGGIGGNYDPEILLNVFRSFQNVYPDCYFLILSKDKIDDSLRGRFTTAGIRRYVILNLPFLEVNSYLALADAGFIYYKISFSTIGRSPTKLGEYWASGVPIFALKGIGDLDAILTRYPGSGVLLSADASNWEAEISGAIFANPVKLREYALDYFHIDKGVVFYKGVYNRLAPAEVTDKAFAAT